jgi:3-deoxy-manno-octulosonate cytidylyltransferase (CMP-KDO synthetase)
VNLTALHPEPKAVAIIPARYQSIRLPGKPLLEIAGRPMVIHTLERALAARNVARALVATDDQRIFDAVVGAGYEATMTRPDHASGSDRLAEVAAALDDFEIIVNVQGDEPLIAPLTIERAVDELIRDPEAMIVTTSEPVESAAEALNPDLVKVVTDAQGRALYFSRSPIPYPRDAVRRHGSLDRALAAEPQLLKNFRKHTGLYAYRRHVLLQFAVWPQASLERIELLEQLRALERAVVIKVIEACAPSIGVDTPEDLERVRKIMEGRC